MVETDAVGDAACVSLCLQLRVRQRKNNRWRNADAEPKSSRAEGKPVSGQTDGAAPQNPTNQVTELQPKQTYYAISYQHLRDFFLKRKKIQRMIRQTPSGGKDITAVFCVHKSIFIVSFYPALQALYGLWLNIHAGISLCQSRRTERAASDGSQTNSHWGKWVKLICTWSFILYYKTISLLSLSVAQTEDADWRKTAKVVKKEQWFPAALLFLILHTFFPFNVLIHTHFEVCVDTISAGVSYSLLRLFKNEAMGLWCQTSKRSLWMKMARDMSAS